MKYLYDTNIFVYYLAAEEAVMKLFAASFLQENQVILSSIVRIELLSYPELTQDEDIAIRDLLSQFETVPLTLEIEEITISLRRQQKIKLPDAILAATAIHTSACLATRNAADFRNVNGLQIYNPWV